MFRGPIRMRLAGLAAGVADEVTGRSVLDGRVLKLAGYEPRSLPAV